MKQACKNISLLMAALMLVGCSSFERDWKRDAVMPPPQDMSGRWIGYWKSDVNGHRGKLRCLVEQRTEAEYTARFKANYQTIFTFTYRVGLRAIGTNDSWEVTGSEDLGALAGGIYRYAGVVTRTNFSATYSSRYDNGIFEMRRPASNKSER